MEFLKPYLSNELFTALKEQLQKEKSIKLANLKSGEYVGKGKYESVKRQLNYYKKQLEILKNI